MSDTETGGNKKGSRIISLFGGRKKPAEPSVIDSPEQQETEKKRADLSEITGRLFRLLDTGPTETVYAAVKELNDCYWGQTDAEFDADGLIKQEVADFMDELVAEREKEKYKLELDLSLCHGQLVVGLVIKSGPESSQNGKSGQKFGPVKLFTLVNRENAKARKVFAGEEIFVNKKS